MPVLEPGLDLGKADRGIGRIRQIDLVVILGTGFPGAFLRERVARTSDDPPACAGESLHGRMADAAACAGQQQGAAGVVLAGPLPRAPTAPPTTTKPPLPPPPRPPPPTSRPT